MCLLIVSLKHEQICMTCLGFKDMQNISVDKLIFGGILLKVKKTKLIFRERPRLSSSGM